MRKRFKQSQTDLLSGDPHVLRNVGSTTCQKENGKLRADVQSWKITLNRACLATLLSMIAIFTSSVTIVNAGDPVTPPMLEGIGYYEMTGKVGVSGASFAGGTEIVIYGQGMSHTPSSLTALFSNDYMGTHQAGPPKPQDVAFSSHTDGGKLKYTTPSIMGVHGKNYEDFDEFSEVVYDLSILDYNSVLQQTKILRCQDPSLDAWCRIRYSRMFTPILYYITPQVVYSDSEFQFIFDPRWAQDKKSPNLPEFPWVEVRLDGYGVDFEGFVEESTGYPNNYKNQVRGRMGAITPTASADIQFRFRVGYAMHMDSTMIRCNYQNTTCYKAKAVARIDSIDAKMGSTTGGQTIIVTGHGFGSKNITTVIDGVPCEVFESDISYFKCTTGPNESPSTDISYLGQHGIRRRYVNSTTYPTFANLALYTVNYTDSLALDLESPQDTKNGFGGNFYQGYFKAPATARYRFYISCDDECQIQFSNVTMDPSKKKVIYTSNSWAPYRAYFTMDGRKQTQWFNLTKDEAYYLEVRHTQWNWAEHVSVAVEIEDPTLAPGHHHTMKEIQRLLVDQVITREMTNVTIMNPDGGLFALGMIDPLTKVNYVGNKINTNASAWEFNQAVRGYYNDIIKSSIDAKKVMYDINGDVTNDVFKSVKSVFTIYLERSIDQATCKQINVQRISGNSIITVSLPKDTQLSNPVMTGAFKIKCALKNGGWNTTIDIYSMNSTNQIRDAIILACPNYREKIEVSNGPKYNYYENGRDILIRFFGHNYDVPQMEIMSSDSMPITGNEPSFNSTTWIPYDPTRLFYEPVPFEFLHTAETSPQVIVTVDGIEAVCASLNCSYKYIPPVTKITNFTLDGNSMTLVGTGLQDNIKTVTFSNVPCSGIKISADLTTITCTVQPVAGFNWLPVVVDANGIIPLDESIQPIEIYYFVSAITPNSDLNPYGGTFVTITGENLPHSFTEGNTLSIFFIGGGKCQVVSVASTQIRCITSKFEAGVTTADLRINVNGMNEGQLSVTVRNDPSKVVSVTPNSVSPVLKTIITLKVSAYSGTLQRDDIVLTAVSQKDKSIIRYINVVEVGFDGSDQYIKGKFGGSESGIYDIFVNLRSYGQLNTEGITLTLIGKVTDFNPKSGSVHGGTLITIDGINFSTDYQDNPVRIGFTDCLVEYSSPTQIKCRTEPRKQQELAQDSFIVFLKTYEEAICDVAADCKYQWTDDAKLQSYSVNFDTNYNEYILTLSGINFASDLNTAEVWIDDGQQQIISISDTEINAKITHIYQSTTLDVEIQLLNGIPGGIGMETLNYNTGITLLPRLHSISPSVGSLGGTLIVADVRGFGVRTQNVTLLTSDTLIDICEKAWVPQYGQLLCKTKENLAVPAGSSLKLKINGAITDCSGVNGECKFETSATLATVTSITFGSDNQTININGAGFSTQIGYTPYFQYLSVFADFVQVLSDFEATARFSNGIPLASVATPGYLSFRSSSSRAIIYATLSSSAKLANPISAAALDSPVSCSFAGGCQVSITQTGLLTSLQSDPSKNTIRVCGQLCTLSAIDSSSTVTKCTIAPLPTTHSIDQFSIIDESYLIGLPFSSISSLTMSVWDGSHQSGWTNNGGNCYFGTAFRAGYIGVLNEVKYFMSRFHRGNFIGKLKFQGSQNGSTWTDIFVVGQEIHEGWNYYNYPQGQELKYRYYRFYGTTWGSCIVGEISLRGYEVIDSTADTYTCQASVSVNGEASYSLTGDIVYQSTLTPLLKSITPRFGSVVGNETVTFEGENFSSVLADYSILLDNRVCTVSFANSTHVQCITGKRPGLYPTPTLQIKIAGFGNVATQGLIFRYVNYWSEPLTWGGEFPPIEGDLVSIPKGLNLLVDVDSTPILSAVVVEGSLIFPPNPNPNHMRTFDAHYVMVRGGTFEAGTEDYPYTSQLLITMHSNRSSPEIPIFGNKVIAMYNGVLDLHGVPRNPTWTELDVTAEIDSVKITLIRDVDWKVGESIVIAPSGYFNTEAEERKIVAIDRANPSKPVITVDSPLENKHFAGVQYFGDNKEEWIEMRAEVGLLTRNIMYRGDPETSAKNEYGAQIMVHSNGMETLTARIEYVHFFNVGQSFQLGRYPIHFHLIGAVHNSYIKGNTIQQSYNRACTIHGVHYLRVTENVAYNVKGHNFFIEDAAETKNLIEKNLAILTRKSWSLLNSDQTPASFWITHPDNIFRGNHAAGSENYGFWFDTKPNPTGPSFDPNQCPENNPLGEFTNNVAHSNGRYGLRIFHKLIPRQYPCQPIILDTTRPDDPHWQNPVIPAVFQNFTSYKNRRNGAIALDIGAVRFENFKVSDNLLAGIEVELQNSVQDGLARVDGALVIGYSDNAEELTAEFPSRGIIGPRTEGWQIHNVRFYNFNISDKGAIGTCSHCFSAPSTDSGARTLTVKGLYFDPKSVTAKIRYQEPYREIIKDLDGSLTGKGPNTWATPYWRHNVQPECEVNKAVYDGIICDSSVQVRRIVFDRYTPNIFTLMDLKVLQWDDNIVGPMNNDSMAKYLLDTNQYSIVPFRPKTSPANAWAIPIVTGHKYKIHWQNGLDFERMQVTLSPHWNPNDKDLYLIHNFTDVRAKFDFLTGNDNIKNLTLLSTNSTVRQTGANVVYNDTSVRQVHFILNGKNATRNPMVIVGNKCDGPCIGAVSTVAIDANQKLWSQATSWKSGKVPLAGENVEVEPGQNLIYDLEESPIYNYVQINGRVAFKQDAPKLHFRCKYLFVRMGELLIGNATTPYLGQAQFTLYGMKEDQHIVYDNSVEAGNKIIANTGLLSFYGQSRIIRSRLLNTAYKGNLTVKVEPGLDWKVNETVVFVATALDWDENDYSKIASYDNVTGLLTLQEPLLNYHWGASVSTGSQYNGVDMRGEVMLMSRNIRIVGNDTDKWGCQVVTSDFVESDGVIRIGRTFMDHVEIYNCSQYDTWKAAVRFDNAAMGHSRVSNSSIHWGHGVALEVKESSNIIFENNNVYRTLKFGLNIETSKNVTIDRNWVVLVNWRNLSAMTAGDPNAGIVMCGQKPKDKCVDVRIINNMVASVEETGVDTTGYTAFHHRCGDYKSVIFQNNIAHSVSGYGAIIFRNASEPDNGVCIEASKFIAYKNRLAGIVSNQATDNVIFTNMTLIDNGYSAIAMIGLEGTNQSARLRNIKFFGETEARDCDYENQCKSAPWLQVCRDKSAIMPSSYAGHNKGPLIDSKPSWPQYKIKADASFGGTTIYENLEFYNFKTGFTYCGKNQRLFLLNIYNADYYPAVRLINSRLENIHQDALAYLMNPPVEWANIDDCGEFPCTSPNNVLIQFERSTFAGQITPQYLNSDFQIISGNDENSGGFASCSKVLTWNGYYCNNDNLAIVLFESLDEDKLTRILSPIQVQSMNLTSRNVLNTFMDHLWDGFYTSMKRLSRFASLIQGGTNMYYQITYTSTPPLRQKFQLKTVQAPVVIRIKYPKAGSYQVQDANGKEIVANTWDSSIQQPYQIKGAKGGFCGENRYVGVINILEFYLNKGCTVFIVPIDSIQSSVRMNWTLNEFFKDGGTTKFVDRIAASLGIKIANVKVVSVYTGSVVVDYQIVEDAQKTLSSTGGIDKVQNNLASLLTSKAINLGAPIMNVQVSATKANAISAVPTTTSSTTVTSTISSKNEKITGPVEITDPYFTAKQVLTSPIRLPTNLLPQNIYNSTIVSVIKTEDEVQNVQKQTMIAVIISIVVVIVIGVVIAYAIYRRFTNAKHEANLNASQKVRTQQDQSSRAHMSPGSPEIIEEELFEEQYHPESNIVDLFGKGIIQKVNEADQVEEHDDQDDMSSQQSSSGSGNVVQHQPNSTKVVSTNQNLNIPSSRGSVDVDRELGFSN